MLRIYLDDLIILYKKELLINNYISLLFYNADINFLIEEFKNLSIIENYEIQVENNLKFLRLKINQKILLKEFRTFLKLLENVYIIEIYQCYMDFDLLHKIKEKTITTGEIFNTINLTQVAISQATGIARNKLNDYIKGRRKINVDIINSIFMIYPLLPMWDIFNCPKELSIKK